MNHVYVVRNTGIEEVKMNDDLAKMVNIVSKPINADLLFHLHGLKEHNLDNQTLKHYYTNMLGLDVEVISAKSKDRYIVEYRNVENLSERWSRDLRLTMAIIANECGEKNIANLTKPSSRFNVGVELATVYNNKETPHFIQSYSTFTIIREQDRKDSIELTLSDTRGIVTDCINVSQGDVILFTDRRLMDHVNLVYKGRVELLSVDVKSNTNDISLQNINLDSYLEGNVAPTDYIKNTLSKIDNAPFTYKWTSGKE